MKYYFFITFLNAFVINESSIYSHTCFLYLQLQTDYLKRKTMQSDHLKAIQEAIAGFLLDEVIDPKGEFYYDPKETWKPDIEQ